MTSTNYIYEYVYLYKWYLHTIVVNEWKRVHQFEDEHEGIYQRVWRVKMEVKNCNYASISNIKLQLNYS